MKYLKSYTFWVITLLILLNITVLGLNLYINLSHKDFKPKQFEYINYYEQDLCSDISKNDFKQLVDNLYKTPHFFKEKALKQGNIKGKSIVLFRYIEMDSNLEAEEFCLAYAHELTHLKYWTNNECFTNYMTFVTLYESGNVYLQNIAIRFGYDVIRGGYAGTDYDCSWYINEYLKGGIK